MLLKEKIQGQCMALLNHLIYNPENTARMIEFKNYSGQQVGLVLWGRLAVMRSNRTAAKGKGGALQF